jgi:RimJ/RimL family protein N-acetyltransferase
MAEADPAREVVFALERDATFLGVLGIHPKDGLAAELGYWIGRPFWGHGYMTEAVTAALIWARESWGARILTSGHFADNPASGGVLVKADFLYTGVVEPRFSVARGEEAATRMMIWLA